MLETSLGQLILNDALPEELRNHGRVLDKKGLSSLLREVAEKYPGHYREISHKLASIGHRVAQDTGGYSFGLEHLSTAKSALKIRQELQGKIDQLVDDDSIDDETREQRIIEATEGLMGRQQDEVYKESIAEKNPLAYQVLSGSRGNKMNLSTLRGSDMLYVDHRGKKIPVPVLHSYSEGLTPAEYWAGTYGARKGVVDTKLATAKSGFVGKQYNQATHRLIVEDHDDAEPPFTTTRGLPVDTLDPDNEGALLAAPHGDYARDTVLTPKILKSLSSAGHARILVRSPLVGSAPNGGVFAKDVGMREYGRLPVRGEYVGMTAAQALSEPLSQGMLSSKHSGGVSGAAKTVGGFEHINSLIQIPKTLKGGATHAEIDGTVTAINDAPGGGKLVTVGGEDHYVPAGTDVTTKVGDTVEAGDVLTEGIPHPGMVVKHKGIGEGRRYFTHAFHDAMKGSGITSHRRNVELLGRGLINHVRLTKETDRHVPGDVVPYHDLERTWEPRPGSYDTDVETANGRYLEKPVLHYTIGTKVRPSVQADLKQFGVKNVHVHDDPAPFEPEMVRAMDNLSHDPDWMTNMYGSGLKGSLLSSVHHGDVSDQEGTSFVPSLAQGTNFGRQGMTKAPKPISSITPVKMSRPREDCPHCGAMLERGDDGHCNQCRKPWPVEKDAGIFNGLDQDFANLTKGRDSSWAPKTTPTPAAPATPTIKAPEPIQAPKAPATPEAAAMPTAKPPAASQPPAMPPAPYMPFTATSPVTSTLPPVQWAIDKGTNLAQSGADVLGFGNYARPAINATHLAATAAGNMYSSPLSLTRRILPYVAASGTAQRFLSPAITTMLGKSAPRALGLAGGWTGGALINGAIDLGGSVLEGVQSARAGNGFVNGLAGKSNRLMQTGLSSPGSDGSADPFNGLVTRNMFYQDKPGNRYEPPTQPGIVDRENLVPNALNAALNPIGAITHNGTAAARNIYQMANANAFNNGTHAVGGVSYETTQANNAAATQRAGLGNSDWQIQQANSGTTSLRNKATGDVVPYSANPDTFLSHFPKTVTENGRPVIDPAKLEQTLNSLFTTQPGLVRTLVRTAARNGHPYFGSQDVLQRYGVDPTAAAE